MIRTEAYVHESALVEPEVSIGAGTRVWHQAHLRTRSRIGARCILGKGVFVDFDVVIGDDCKLQNYVCVYHGVTLERGVFLGPHVVFANDKLPRATSPDFAPLRDGDWTVGESRVCEGASIGANATILPGVTIGKWAMIGSGAVVTKDIPSYAIAVGSPARVIGYACACGLRMNSSTCAKCGPLPADHPLAKQAQ